MNQRNEIMPRERVLLAIEHKETDRLPIDFGGRISGVAVSVYEEINRILGLAKPVRIFNNRLQTARVEEEVLKLFRVDTRHIALAPALSWNPQYDENGNYKDEWGIKLFKPDGGFYYDYVEAPLGEATIDDLENYKWPEAKDLSRLEGKLEEARALTEDGQYALFTGFKGVFERSWALRGFDQFLMDMIIDKPFAEALLDKVLEVQKAIFGPFLEEISPYLDVMTFTDDLGTQDSLLVSPQLYRELIKPRHLEWIKFVKQKCNARIAFHSCGRIADFLLDILETGVEIINPVQVTAANMDPVGLKKQFGQDICFWGGLDTQAILPTGSSFQVEGAVKNVVEILGQGGGYIFAPVHNIQPLTPAENVIKMFEVAREL